MEESEKQVNVSRVPLNAGLDPLHGKCVVCRFATKTKRKNEMQCCNPKAITFGIGAIGWGGGDPKAQVHKLFGCIYWVA